MSDPTYIIPQTWRCVPCNDHGVGTVDIHLAGDSHQDHARAAESQRSWDLKFMGMAKHVAGWSKDRSSKVGSVVVGPDKEIRATGFNGFARGVNDNVEERHQRPAKYMWTVHSEENSLLNAARSGVSTNGCTMFMYFPSGGPPCVNCARGIIQAGIVRVVVEGSLNPMDWREDWRASMLVSVEMFHEAGVLLETVTE